MTTPILTRRQYMQRASVSHDDYYAQFVTQQTLDHVNAAFEVETLGVALDADRHLNSIPLNRWDAIAHRPTEAKGFVATLPMNRAAIAAAGETVTRAVLVCIAKRAARMLVEQQMSQSAVQAA